MQNNYQPSNEQDAWIALIGVMISLDNDVSELEGKIFTELLAYNGFFKGIDGYFFYRKSSDYRKVNGSEGVLNGAIPHISEQNKNQLFCILSEIAFLSGAADNASRSMLLQIRDKLSIENSFVDACFLVMASKYKYSIGA